MAVLMSSAHVSFFAAKMFLMQRHTFHSWNKSLVNTMVRVFTMFRTTLRTTKTARSGSGSRTIGVGLKCTISLHTLRNLTPKSPFGNTLEKLVHIINTSKMRRKFSRPSPAFFGACNADQSKSGVSCSLFCDSICPFNYVRLYIRTRQ